MPFEINYKRLFTVEFWQNFHLNQGAEEFAALSASQQEEQLENYRSSYRFSEVFRVVPMSDTERTLAGLGLLWRPSSTGFFAAAPVEEIPGGQYRLRRPPTGSLRLRFALSLSVPAFVNYTNLSLRDHQQKIYYFSNLAEQIDRPRSYPYLSHTPPGYQPGSSYEAGDVVRRRQRPQSRGLYLCARDGSHGRPPGNPGSSSPWKALSGRNYVTGDDRVSLYPPVFTFGFPAETVVEASFTATNAAGDAYDAGSITAPNGQTLSRFVVDLAALTAGRYRLDVAGLDVDDDPYTHTEEIYIDPELPGQKVFGLVEIFHAPAHPVDAFSLLAANDRLRRPEYIVHFLNRHTFWRYLFDTTPDPAPDASDFRRIDDRQYVSKALLPLTSSFIPLRAGGVRLLPNPSTNMIKPENNRLYSDIHVHP